MRNDLKIGLAIGGLAFFLLFLVLYLAFTQPKTVAVAGPTGTVTATDPIPPAVRPSDLSKSAGTDRLVGPIVIPDTANPTAAGTDREGSKPAPKSDGRPVLTPLIGSQISPPPVKGTAGDNERQGDNGWLARYSSDGNPPPDVSRTPSPAGVARTFANPDGPADTAPNGLTNPTGPIAVPAGSSQAGNGATASGGKTYAVQEGDNLTTIAEKVYGSGSQWNRIAAANPTVDPRRLRIGTVLNVPADGGTPAAAQPTAGSSAEPAVGANEYRVGPNDSLSSIAKKELGDERRWEALYNLNRAAIGDDPGALKLGTVLRLK